MRRRTKQRSESRWLLCVDSGGRITLPKVPETPLEWCHGDMLGVDLLENGKGVTVRNLSWNLRVCVAELKGLRAARPESQDSLRADELAKAAAALADIIYPVDQSSTHTQFAQQAFALTQTKARIKREGLTDKVDVVLASLEARRLSYECVQQIRGE